jgi:hypothetical protein
LVDVGAATGCDVRRSRRVRPLGAPSIDGPDFGVPVRGVGVCCTIEIALGRSDR